MLPPVPEPVPVPPDVVVCGCVVTTCTVDVAVWAVGVIGKGSVCVATGVGDTGLRVWGRLGVTVPSAVGE